MISKHKKKQVNNKNTVGSVMTGLAGGVVIAKVAVATTVALTDEKNREKFKRVLMDVKDQIIDYAETLKIVRDVQKATHAIKNLNRHRKSYEWRGGDIL